MVLLALAPAGAAAAASTAFVPQTLADAATASPDQLFRVIVQGQPSTTLASLEAGVAQTQVDSPAPQGGINNAFSSIDAVAAELTGQQILDLAQTPGIFAVTSDAPLRASVVDPPVALEPPTIAGTPAAGESLTASPGQWSGAQPLDYAYQWRRCDTAAACSDIAGAGAPVYIVSADDLGSTLVVGVTATNADGSATSTSAATPVVSSPAPPPVVVPPAAFVFPSVTGTATTGETLTADDGVWNGGPVALAHQWQRCSPAGDACLDIAAATGQTYLLGANDAGFTLRVVVTATNAFGSAAAASNVSAVVATPPPPAVVPPAAVMPPAVTGSAVIGELLTADDGVWSGGPVALARQWQRCSPAGDACLNVDGATGQTYLLGADDVGSTIVVVVTATDAFGTGLAASAASEVVAGAASTPPPPPPPSVVSNPTVTGAPVAGETLTAGDGTWSGDAIALGQQWQRCSPGGDACLDVAGASGQTYLLGADDAGSTVRVVVTATDAAGSASAASGATGVIAPAALPNPPPPPSMITAPTLTGTATAGETLTAEDGTWSGDAVTLAQQWQRCSATGAACLDVVGATAQTYPLGADDVGSTVRVVVTATDPSGMGLAASMTSDVVAQAAPAPSPSLPPGETSAPTLSGTATAGDTLTVDDGTWSGDAVALTQQWQRCSPAGDACVDIAGATGLTFLLGSDDVGSTVQVVVTATNASGTATAASSLTDVVAPVTIPATPPSMTSAPVITGTTTAGETLTVDDGAWSGDAVALTQQWQRCSAAGDACVDIAGATGLQYVLGADDVGSTVSVVVTANDAFGSTSAAATVTAVVVPAVAIPPVNPVPAAPVNVTLPTFLGPLVVGSSLVGQPGRWASTGGSQEYSFQWRRCDTAGSCVVVGTSPSYTPVDADAGSQLKLTVTADVVSLGVPSATVSATSALGKRIAPRTRSGFWSWQLGAYAAGLDAQWTAVAQADDKPPAIAIVDSGVDPGLPGLNGSVVRQVRLSSLPQGTAPDGYGHGSFVAEVAAGHGAGEAGAAPKAPIVSLDVMNDNGMALTSDVVAAADWIYTHRNENGVQIRVANFSLIGSSPSSVQFDPLDRALERLWLSGIVVVTAAGNYGVDGQASPVGFSPANDPFAITVGASDPAGTVSTSDDFAAPWSVYGHTLDGFAKPEIGAPGRYIVAPIPTDSALYRLRPASVVSPGRIQLSGTSFAAPLVAGVAANLLALHPNWTPDQVKGALMVSAANPGAAAQFSLGVGEVDAAAASAVTHPPNPNLALESFLVPDPAGGTTPAFDAASWASTVQADTSWGTAAWGTAAWGTAAWGTAAWGTAYWSSLSTSTAAWGTASLSAGTPDNTGADVLPAGAYWMHWPF